MFKRGHENLSFEEAIRVETDRLNAIDDEDFRNPKFVSNSHKRYSYLSRGRYAEQLNRWFKRFSREQLLIIQSESLFTDANAELQRVSEFLGLTDQSPLKIANRGSYSPMNTQTRTQLLAYFEPYNHDLFGLLGEEFDWS